MVDIDKDWPCIPLLVDHNNPTMFFHTRPTHSVPIGTCLEARQVDGHKPPVPVERTLPEAVAVAEPPQLLSCPARGHPIRTVTRHRDDDHDENDILHGNIGTFQQMASVTPPWPRSAEQKVFFLPFQHLCFFFFRRRGSFFKDIKHATLLLQPFREQTEIMGKKFIFSTYFLSLDHCRVSLPSTQKSRLHAKSEGKGKKIWGYYFISIRHASCQGNSLLLLLYIS